MNAFRVWIRRSASDDTQLQKKSVDDEDNRKRLFAVSTDDSQEVSRLNIDARDSRPSIIPFDKMLGLTRNQPSDDSRDAAPVDDYDETLFQYESLTYFNLPKPSPGEVVIAVQASTISSLKMKVKKEFTIHNVALDLDGGIAIVGIVREIGTGVDNIKVGDRVATIVKSAMNNARYAQVSATMIAKVPFGLDSAEAAATAYNHLIAFQTLTHGIINPHFRYSQNLFHEKNILIMDAISVTGQAMVQLGKYFGAKNILTPASQTKHEFLKSLGAVPISQDPNDWINELKGCIHMLIDTLMTNGTRYSGLPKVLVPNGKLIYSSLPISTESLKHGSTDSWKAFIQQAIAQTSLICLETSDATYYDLFSSIENYPDLLQVRIFFIMSISHSEDNILIYLHFIMITFYFSFSIIE